MRAFLLLEHLVQVVGISHILLEILFQEVLFVCLRIFQDIAARCHPELKVVCVVNGWLTDVLIEQVNVFACHPILKSLLFELKPLDLLSE